MDRSPLVREGRRSLLGAVGPVAVCILVVIWLCGFTAAMLAAHGWEIFSPVAWMGQLSSGLPDDRLWIGRLFGIIAWLVLVVGAIALPLIVLILAGRRIAHRMRRWSRLRGFDPGAVPDLVVLLDDDDLFGHIAARSRRVALRGVLERLAPDTGLARALAGETRVWLLGDLDRMPGHGRPPMAAGATAVPTADRVTVARATAVRAVAAATAGETVVAAVAAGNEPSRPPSLGRTTGRHPRKEPARGACG